MRSVFLFKLLFLFLFLSCKNGVTLEKIEHQKNMNLLIENCWNQKDISIIDSIFDENVTRTVNHVRVANNSAELKALLQIYFTGFPDLILVRNNITVMNDHTFFEWTISGTNTGVFGEMIATGKKVEISGITKTIFNDNGKILSEEVYYNELQLLQQLGYDLIPPNVE